MLNNIHPAIIWSVIGLLGSGVFVWVLSWFVASYIIYTKTLKRCESDTWSRDIPKDAPPKTIQIYNEGIAWSQANIDKKHDVHIVRDGCNLYGEYYDLGYDRCVIVLSGRTESLTYGYYFAIPYAKNGCNVLVLDPRAHGLSDGEYNTIGYEESIDDIAWINYISETFGIKSFILHGICIGGAGGTFALTSGKCPPLVDGIVVEGMFSRFLETMRNHIIERKKSTFVTLDLIDAWMKRYTGHSMKYGPIDCIDKLDVPLLMLHSKEDIYSLPSHAQMLYDKAGSSKKKIVWFEHGAHSMLRITNTELYDRSIADFLAELPVKSK